MPRPDLITCHVGADRAAWVRATKYPLSAEVKRLIDSARATAQPEPSGPPDLDTITGRYVALMTALQAREERIRLALRAFAALAGRMSVGGRVPLEELAAAVDELEVAMAPGPKENP